MGEPRTFWPCIDPIFDCVLECTSIVGVSKRGRVCIRSVFQEEQVNLVIKNDATAAVLRFCVEKGFRFS